MMNLLLKYEGYPPAVVAALCLHLFLLWIIFEKDFEPSEFVRIDQPTMAATAVQQNPQKLRRLEEIQQQRQRELDAQRRREADQAARQREAEAQRAREQEAEQRRIAQQQQQQREQEAERQRLAQQEADRQAREKAAAEAAEQQRRLLAEQQRQQQLANEAAERQRQSQQAEAQAAENNLVSQYVSIIQNLIRQNWIIPPSARCNMVAVVELRLTPVGDVVNNAIVQSSGDAAFDRSVLQAVDRVGSFPEVRELPNPVFERNFRRFTLTFQPQDLLRC